MSARAPKVSSTTLKPADELQELQRQIDALRNAVNQLTLIRH